jgi:hypothetical protein
LRTGFIAPLLVAGIVCYRYGYGVVGVVRVNGRGGVVAVGEDTA